LEDQGTDIAYTLSGPSGDLVPASDGSIDDVLFKVEVKSSSESLGTVVGSASAFIGQRAEVAAFASENAVFEGWYENGAKIEGAGSVYEFSIQSDRELVAHFKGDGATAPAAPTEAPTSAPTPAAEPAVPPEDALHRLGLLAGTGTGPDGKPDFGLDKPLTRLEALALVIRMMGVEKEAQAYKGANPFIDVPSWGGKYAAYGRKAGITSGVDPSKGLFVPDRQVTFQEFTAFMLRVLGYSEANGDFEFESAQAKAEEIGLFSPYDAQRISSGGFLRGSAALELVDALLTSPKGGSDPQIAVLADGGVFSQEDASWFLENAR
jgi:hypothetical protein